MSASIIWRYKNLLPLPKLLCKNIAKFYVKIGRLYAAILATVNPVYTYTDSEGVQKSSGLLEKIIADKKNKIFMELYGLWHWWR